MMIWVITISYTQNPFPKQNPTAHRDNFPISATSLNNAEPDMVIKNFCDTGFISGNQIQEFIPAFNPIPLMRIKISEFDSILMKSGKDLTQQQVVVESGWHGLSTYIIPEDLDIGNIFAPNIEQLMILYNFAGVFFPSQQVNTLENWNPQSGYVAKFNQGSVVEFAGQLNQTRRITLVSGWNLIPVLSTCPADITQLFENKDVWVVKEVAGFRLYWPEMGINTIGELLPGSAYFVLMHNTEEIMFPNCGLQAWQCGDPLIDTRDSQSYNTVQIGTQCWMAENLNVGTITPPFGESNNGIIEKSCYDDNPANCDEYGGLYFWDEIMNYSTGEYNHGICPDGWHIPSRGQWDEMILYLGGTTLAGGKLKETGYQHWDEPNTGATNESGFTAYGAGIGVAGEYDGFKQWNLFWTSSKISLEPVLEFLWNQSGEVIFGSGDPMFYYYGSLRCIKTQCPVFTTANAGPDQLNVEGNSTILEGNSTPNLEESGEWTIVSGNLGSFSDISDPHSAFRGNPTESYVLSWAISNICGETDADSVMISFAPAATSYCGGITELTYDGQVYHTVQIGDQCWLKENLNIGQMINGSTNQTDNSIIEKYCYNNESDSCAEYGGLYQWNELMQYTTQPGAQGICPEGWHIPTSLDACILASFVDETTNCNDPFDILSYTAGGKLKEEGFRHWMDPNDGATNETGFTALGSGANWENSHAFSGIRQFGYYASSTRNSEDYNLGFYMVRVQAHLRKYHSELSRGVSVRCIKDSGTPAWGCGDPLIDTRDNQSYNTVQIGEQCWMAENLNVGTKINSTLSGYQQTNNETIEKYCYYNDVDNCNVYGGLYEWPEMMQYLMNEGVQGICPDGWHIPSNSEYTTLTNFLGTDAGGKMKSTGTIEQGNGLWYEPNEGATNSSGFTGLPGSDEYFSNIGFNGNFWSSSPSGQNTARYRALGFESVDLESYTYDKNIGLSVRCIKGCPEEPSQSNAGPDQINVTGNSVTLAANTPVNYSGFWAVTSGTGGTIVEPSNPASEFIGASGREYTLSWTITTQCGSSVDEVVISFAEFTCGNEFEYDGLSYGTVLIGEQCWMSENLNAGTKINSTSSGSQQLNNGIIEKYCYDNNLAQCNTFGGLYEWDEAMQYSNHEGAQGICLVGWHIPTDAEWTILTNYLGGSNAAGGAMKSTGTLQAGTGLWNSPNTGATNSSGFTAFPGGRRYSDNGIIINRNQYAFFWTSTLQTTSYPINPFLRSINYFGPKITSYEQPGSQGVSIRCLKDCEPQPDQSNAGPNQINVPGISTTLNGNSPSLGVGIWSVINGTGGVIADPLNPVSQFQGLATQTYRLTWTISNECGKSVDTVLISFASIPAPYCPGLPTVSYEGKTYNTVQIGVQCWMKENLDVGIMINNYSGGMVQTDNGTIEKYCYYSNYYPHCEIYGGLYEWNEAMQYVDEEGAQGICPSGWHIPDDWDWLLLTEYLGGSENAGGKMKSIGTLEAGTGLWHVPNTGADNVSGFSGDPCGIRDGFGGAFINENYWAYFWSSSQKDAEFAWAQNLDYEASSVLRNNHNKNLGYSVRCIKNCITPPTQSDAGPDQLNLSGNATQLAGNVPMSGTGIWNIIDGTGATITDNLNPASTFEGQANSIYTLTWTILTDCDISVDTVLISFTGINTACPGIPTVDYLGQTYHTVKIGTQCWLKENLNAGTMINGNNSGNLQTNNGVIEKFCFNNLSSNCDIYGGLYEWDEAMQYTTNEGAQGICPPGWHIPSDGQFIMLENYLGGPEAAGGKLKSNGTLELGSGLWFSPNTGATNESDFTGHPGGFFQNYNSHFSGLGNWGYFRSSTVKTSTASWCFHLSYDYTNFTREDNYRVDGFSVRCIKDCIPEPTPSKAGPDQRNIPGTATALMGNTPSSGAGIWHLVSGTGGNIVDPQNPVSEFTGAAIGSYTLTWTISTECGSNTDTVFISFSNVPSCPGIPTIPYEGKVYHTVQIGNQCWIKENLNAGTMINNSQSGQIQTDNGLQEKYCYDNDPYNCDIYGGLYEWNEAMQYVFIEGARGICMDGWHIATDGEWTILSDFLGGTGVAGGKLKSTGTLEAGTGLWKSPNTGGTNISSFTGYPAGARYSTGEWQAKTYGGYFWSSSQKDEPTAWYRVMVYGYADFWRNSYSKEGGYSVRCLKD